MPVVRAVGWGVGAAVVRGDSSAGLGSKGGGDALDLGVAEVADASLSRVLGARVCRRERERVVEADGRVELAGEVLKVGLGLHAVEEERKRAGVKKHVWCLAHGVASVARRRVPATAEGCPREHVPHGRRAARGPQRRDERKCNRRKGERHAAEHTEQHEVSVPVRRHGR